MSYSLALSGGDLVAQGSQLAIVSGSDFLKQSMDLWIRERYGIDRFHPTFGSTLENYIGQVVDSDTRVEIIDELTRVLHNYQAVQLQAFKDSPQNFSASELMMSVLAINATVSYDTVSASVTVANGDQAPVSVKTSNSTVGA